MKLDQVRQNLLIAAQQNRTYPFLQTALPYLDQVPQDAEMRLHAVTHLARLGLVGPALELVENHPDLLHQAPQLKPIFDDLAQQPTGQVDWLRCRHTFEANLEVAANRYELCRRYEKDIRTATHNLDLHQCTDGNYQLSRQIGSAPRRWLPSIIESVKTVEQAALCPTPQTLFCFPYLIEGVAFGELIRKIYDGTNDMFLNFAPEIHLIERNWAQLAVWLHLADHRDLLTDPRVLLWLGPDAESAFADHHRSRPDRPLPQASIHQPGWAAAATPCARQTLTQLSDEHDQKVALLRQSILQKLQDSSAFDHYARRFADRRDRPLRILGVTSRFTTFLQYSMRDIGQAVKALGHEFEMLIETDDHTATIPRPQTLDRIDAFLPDLIILIDHNRHEYDDLYDFPIPYCCWIQDDMAHLFQPGTGDKLSPYDIVVGHAARSRLAPAGYPDAQRHPVPIPVNHRMFSNDPASADDLRKYECDLSFVSNLSITAEAFLEESLQKASQPQIHKLFAAVFETFKPKIINGWVPGSFRQTAGIIQQIGGEMGLSLSNQDAHRVRREFADRLINIFFRHQVLQWAADMGLDLHLYGRGWESHPTLAKHAKGVAEHGHHSRCIFQASKINLQLMPSAAVHQRLLEGLASGGFFLIRQTTFDMAGTLTQSIAKDCRRLNIQTETELWNTEETELRRKVHQLNDLLYAPKRLRKGLVEDLLATLDRGYSMEASSYLPHYNQISFANQPDFNELVARFLQDPDARHQIAASQRRRVMDTLTYDAAMESIFDFAANYFATKAETDHEASAICSKGGLASS